MNCRNIVKSFSVGVFTVAIMFSTVVFGEDAAEKVAYETGFYYTVKEGDTLWDISQHFSDSPWLWPDLWKENSQIANPHWIYPGERIRLYLKKGEFAQKKEEVSQPVKTSVPVAPPTEGVYFLYSGIDQVGFIRKPAVTPTGTLFKVEGDKKLISIGDLVYIRPQEDGKSNFVPGSRHTVFRTLAPTDEKNAKSTIGTQHFILGILEITRNEPDFAMGTIIKSYRRMKIGDHLMPYQRRSPEILLKESTAGIDGKIINGEEHTKIMGEQQLAFIDKGRKDNIAAGQQYTLYNQTEHKLDQKSKKTVLLPPLDIGTMMVLHTEEETSTVLITYSDREIKRGEKYRTPEM